MGEWPSFRAEKGKEKGGVPQASGTPSLIKVKYMWANTFFRRVIGLGSPNEGTAGQKRGGNGSKSSEKLG